MRFRTRVAVVVITLIVGWVLAAPYRHSFSVSDSTSDNPHTSPLTLQIQRTPTPAPVPRSASHDHHWPSEAIVVDDTARPQPSFSTFSTVLDGHPETPRTALEPMPIDNARSSPRTLIPVSLLDIQFGSVPVEATGEHTLRPSAGDQKHFSLRPLSVVPEGQQQGRSSASAHFVLPVSKTWHRIVNGDNLPKLAGTYLGNPQLALLIYEANRDVLVSPEILPIGKELRIPNMPHADRNVRASQSATTVSGNTTTLMSPLLPTTPKPASQLAPFQNLP